MFDLSAYLGTRREAVEAHLRQHMPAAELRPARLHAAMRYSLFGGGKRLRPILAMAAAESVGGRGTEALHPGAALELLHTYTLIHDDLPAMDDDDLRRGRKTCHIEFDEATAILAGDALQTLAFQWLSTSHAPCPYTAADYVRELAVAAGSEGVIGGQMEDIAAEGRPLDAATLDYIHAHKTGDLIVAAVRIGGIAGGASATLLEHLTNYARAAGLAFQIADDILNVTATAEQLGKGVGTDAARGKMTYVAVYGLEEARRRAAALIEEAEAAIAPLGSPAEPLRALARHLVERTS